MSYNTATKVLKALEEIVISLQIKKCPVRLYLRANKGVYIYTAGCLTLKRNELKKILVIILDDCLIM